MSDGEERRENCPDCRKQIHPTDLHPTHDAIAASPLAFSAREGAHKKKCSYALARRAAEEIAQAPVDLMTATDPDRIYFLAVKDAEHGTHYSIPNPSRDLGTAMRLVEDDEVAFMKFVDEQGRTGEECNIYKPQPNGNNGVTAHALHEECNCDVNECRALAVLRAVGKMEGWDA